MRSLILVIILALLLQGQGVPIEDFFIVDGSSSMAAGSQIIDNLATDCGGVTRFSVVVEGTANLSSTTDIEITFTPFLVTSTDLDGSSMYTVPNNLLQLGSVQNVSELENLYKEYYPRNAKERPFVIERMIIITWELSNTADEKNKFQVVAAFNETKNSIFVLYQYQDGMLQWSSPDSKVELHICNDDWTEDPANILDNSNVEENGRYAFLYNDSGIHPAVICTEGCSLTNGYCTMKNECICLDGWMGDTCKEIACEAECLINGRCDEAYVCTCNSDQWSGDTCTIPRCNNCVMGNGMCTVPDVCVCNPGWSGQDCSVPLCDAACSVNGNCVGPQNCQCNNGWDGNNCMDPVCIACDNGQCTAPFTCECDHPGWSGDACDVANCSAECMINGRCDIPNNCTCDEGWKGEICDEPICLEGCSFDFGFCELPGQCNCTEGYIGELCDSTPEPPILSATEIGLLAAGLSVFVIICAVAVATVLLAIRFC